MTTIRFGRTNAQVSRISLGTWAHGGPNKNGPVNVGWTGHDDGLARHALKDAYDKGIHHWDTADVYGNGRAESLIGEMWGEVPRQDIFLATKVGWDRGGYSHWYHPEMIRSHLERSLKNLKTDYVDVYYLHHCDFGPNGQYFDAANELVHRFQEEGKTRFVGLSDWDLPKIMKYIDRVNPDVVQPYRNVVDDAYESSGLKAYVETHDVGVAFFSPLRHGLLLGKYTEPTKFGTGDFRSGVAGFADQSVIDLMKQNRAKLESKFSGIDEPVLHGLLGALLQDSPTGCVLVGMRNPNQVASAAKISQPLSADDAAWVKSLYQK